MTRELDKYGSCISTTGWTLESLQDRSQISPEEIRRTIQLEISVKVGWPLFTQLRPNRIVSASRPAFPDA